MHSLVLHIEEWILCCGQLQYKYDWFIKILDNGPVLSLKLSTDSIYVYQIFVSLCVVYLCIRYNMYSMLTTTYIEVDIKGLVTGLELALVTPAAMPVVFNPP